MILANVFERRSRRTHALESDRGIALVVGLMMALVFAPVLGLHVAASRLNGPVASAVAAPVSVDLAAERKAGPG